MPAAAPLVDRFWAKVDQSAGPDGCWLPWRSVPRVPSHGQRYGNLQERRNGQRIVWLARLAWVIAYGPVPGSLHVLHHCDNPPCCNPRHLFVGTRLDNTMDCVLKGRINKKLEARQVAEIRADQTTNYCQLARQYRVTPPAIRAIKQRRIWRHV